MQTHGAAQDHALGYQLWFFTVPRETLSVWARDAADSPSVVYQERDESAIRLIQISDLYLDATVRVRQRANVSDVAIPTNPDRRAFG